MSASASVGVSAAAERSRRGYVLDSDALLAYFEGESGGEKVRDLLEAAERRRTTLYLSLINWGEVGYIVAREKGEGAAREVLARIDAMPIRLRGIDRALVQAAADLKAHHAIAYADAFAAATANRLRVAVVTGDPEFRSLGDQVDVVWTR